MLYKVWSQNRMKKHDSKKPGVVEEKRLVRFSFIATQMTEALARFEIFMRMETLKVAKPYHYMEVPPPPPPPPRAIDMHYTVK